MRVHTLESEVIAPGTLDETFAFFEDPRNLARITPETMGFEIVSQDYEMRRGLEIEYRVGVFGLKLPWRSVISEYNPPWSFVDEAVQSPYAMWRHLHTFRQTDAGTVVTDHVNYAMPFSPLGELGHFLVRRELLRIFRYRVEAMTRYLGNMVEVRKPTVR